MLSHVLQPSLTCMLPILVSKMAESGIIVCETERNEQLPEEAGNFVRHKTYLYGKAKITVYREREEQEEE